MGLKIEAKTMKLNLINKSQSRIPRRFLQDWVKALSAALKKRGFPTSLKDKELLVVFLDKAQAKKLNQEFRGRNYATDVLSFEPIDPASLGELILCPQVLKKQAKEHGLTYQLELGYMVLHGVLHLLGFDHEGSEVEANEMFELQDGIFDAISNRYVHYSRNTHRKKTDH